MPSFKGFSVLKYINLPVFFVSLAIGLIGVYMSDPFKRKVYIYPSPDNVDILQYKDKTRKTRQIVLLQIFDRE